MYFKSSLFNFVVEKERDRDKVLIFNTLSGCVCRLENAIWERLESDTDIDETIPFFDSLLKQGIIVPQELDEAGFVLQRENQAKYAVKADTLNFVITPTMKCNLKCYYCFEAKQSDCGLMTEDTAAKIIAFISKSISSDTKKIHIGWFGGEPLVAYETIKSFSKEIIALCESKNLTYSSSMITNGILLTKEKATVLKEECKLNSVQITLDGTEKEYCLRKRATPEQYNAVLNNIADCCETFRVIVRLNCDKKNYSDLLAVTDELLRNRKLEEKIKIYLAPVTDYLGEGISCCSDNEFDEYAIKFDEYLIKNYPAYKYPPELPKSRFIFCGLKRNNSFAIGVHGEIYKCEHDFGNDDKIIGRAESGIFYNKYYNDFMKLELSDKCKQCRLLPICLGGCPSRRYDTKKEICTFTEQLVRYKIKKIVSLQENQRKA
jgi:uncharacterized protein